MSVSLINGHIDDDEIDASKQMPKKVVGEQWWCEIAYFCPTCKEDIRRKGADHCGRCGQALDWGEEDG